MTGLWLLLPVTLAPAIDGALATREAGVQHVATAGLWLAWTVGVVCLLVPRTSSLTVFRVLVPGGPAAGLAAALAGPGTAAPAVVAAGLAIATLAAGGAATAWFGDVFVNGSSYGDERRFLLRPPAALLFGPIELAWAALAGLPVGGALLLASGAWAPGLALLAVGAPVAVVLGRAMHGLTRRWLVFVPAGVVVHDYTTLTDSILTQKRHVLGVRPAEAEPGAARDGSPPVDLTAGAAGLALQLDFAEPVPVVRRPSARPGTGAVAAPVDTLAVLVAPSRPGPCLRFAASRFRRPHVLDP